MEEIAQATEQAVDERAASDLRENVGDCGCLPLVGLTGGGSGNTPVGLNRTLRWLLERAQTSRIGTFYLYYAVRALLVDTCRSVS